MTDEVKPFRLAFREEGEFVNCYLAPPESMQNALLLASIRRTLLGDSAELFDLYKELMKQWATPAVERLFGETPRYEEERAPEHERAGKA